MPIKKSPLKFGEIYKLLIINFSGANYGEGAPLSSMGISIPK